MADESDHNNEEGYVVKVRGLPWSTTVDEIMKFFGDCSITHGKAGIHMTMSREGRPSGEAYIEMDSDEDIEKACKRDRDHMGHRYIEVFKAKRGEMEWVIKRSGLNLENVMDDGCVRLRGLPFGCSKEEIAQFFSGLEILPNGISLPTDYTGRSTGEAYVQFVNKDVAERALQKHKEKIGHRYIEIFRSSLSEVRASISPKMRGGPMGGFNQRPAPYDRGSRFGGMNRFNNNGRGNRGGNRDFDNGLGGWNNGNNYQSRGNNMGGGGGGGMRGNMDMGMKGGGNYRGGNDNWNYNDGGGMHCVHMRGLPFRATEQDIADFFRPLSPINIRIILENGGRASGEADVEFASHEEALKAMSKDKSHMSHRYIELFLNSSPSQNMGGGNNSGMGGNMGMTGMGGNMGGGGGNMGGGGCNMGGGGGNMGGGGGNMGGGGGNMGGGGGNMGGGGGNMGGGGGNMGGGGGHMGGGGGHMGGGGGNMGGGSMGGGGGNMGGGGGNMGGGGNNMGGGGGGGGGGMLGGIGNFCGGLGSNFRPGYSPNNRGYGNNQLSGNNYNSF